MGKKQVQ